MVKDIFNKKPAKFKEAELHKSAGILDDYAIRKNVATREGTIEKTPVEDNDLVNKAYVDSMDFWQRVGTILSPKTSGDTINANLGSGFFDSTGRGWEFSKYDPYGTGTTYFPVINAYSSTGVLGAGMINKGIYVKDDAYPVVYITNSNFTKNIQLAYYGADDEGWLGAIGVSKFRVLSSFTDGFVSESVMGLVGNDIARVRLFFDPNESGTQQCWLGRTGMPVDDYTLYTLGTLKIESGDGVIYSPDNNFYKFGTGFDAGIKYDGTNFLFYSKLVGTGDFKFMDGAVYGVGGFKSSDGSAGITTTQTFLDGSGATKTMTIKNGLITGIA